MTKEEIQAKIIFLRNKMRIISDYREMPEDVKLTNISLLLREIYELEKLLNNDNT